MKTNIVLSRKRGAILNRTIHRNRPIILVCVLCAVLFLMTACISVSSSKPERILEVELIAPGLKINQGNVFDLPWDWIKCVMVGIWWSRDLVVGKCVRIANIFPNYRLSLSSSGTCWCSYAFHCASPGSMFISQNVRLINWKLPHNVRSSFHT